MLLSSKASRCATLLLAVILAGCDCIRSDQFRIIAERSPAENDEQSVVMRNLDLTAQKFQLAPVSRVYRDSILEYANAHGEARLVERKVGDDLLIDLWLWNPGCNLRINLLYDKMKRYLASSMRDVFGD